MTSTMNGERITGTRNEQYDLVSILYPPTDLRLSDIPDPQPAIASRRQAQHRHRAFQ